MGTILLIILVLILIGSIPAWPYSAGWGYYPSGGIGLIPPQFDTALAAHPTIKVVIMDGGGNDVLLPDTAKGMILTVAIILPATTGA